jgi:hypothetical protein
MIRRLLLLLAMLAAPSPALAWWEYGHETVARIAWLEASPRTRAEITRLLAQSRLLDTPTCPARTIADASYWPDCIKELGERFSYASPWHYQNVDICRPFDLEAPCRDGNCVSAQIERQARLLADRRLPVRERIMALAFLVHFMGDLHQPMHGGDHGDLGGNRLRVSYGVIAGRTNLHLAWDGYLAERGMTTPPGNAAGILSEVSAVDRVSMRQGDVAAWSRESWEVSREFAYGTVLADPCAATPEERPVITEEITRRLIPIVRQQAARGGIRLARILDAVLDPSRAGDNPIPARR